MLRIIIKIWTRNKKLMKILKNIVMSKILKIKYKINIIKMIFKLKI